MVESRGHQLGDLSLTSFIINSISYPQVLKSKAPLHVEFVYVLISRRSVMSIF